MRRSLSLVIGLALVGTVSATSGQAQDSDTPFCNAVFVGLNNIIDDFGHDRMKKMVGRQSGPRLAAFFLDRNFEPLFGATIDQIAQNQRQAVATRIVECRQYGAIAERGTMYTQSADTLGHMLGFIYREMNIPPYQYYLMAKETHEKFDDVMEGEFSDLGTGFSAYSQAILLEQEIEKDFAIVVPSERRKLQQVLTDQRKAILTSSIDNVQIQLKALAPSAVSISEATKLVQPLRNLQSVDSQDQMQIVQALRTSDQEMLRLIEGIMIDLNTTDRLSSTKSLLNIVSKVSDVATDAVLRFRRDALQELAEQLSGQLDSATTVNDVVALRDQLGSKIAFNVDNELPIISALINNIEKKLGALQQEQYQIDCKQQFAELGFADELLQFDVVASNGTVKLWQLLCGMRDRGIQISALALPSSEEPEYSIEMTLRNGDFVRLNLKSAKVSANTEVLVGTSYANVLESSDFSLDSWKQFVANFSGL